MNTKETQQATKNEMVSLYDYLGHAAGSELGKEVATAATLMRVPMDNREVTTKTYQGRIILYPRWFLDNYFTDKSTQTIQAFQL